MSPDPAARERSPLESAGQAGIMVVLTAAILLRFWRLDALGLWTDEGWTWRTASGTLADLIRRCLTEDASPPLYYLLTWIPLRFADGEAHLRLVSALASVGLVWLTYRIARLFADRRTATLAAGLSALSTYQIQYAQEARTYATVAFFTVLSFYLFARAVYQGRRKDWLPYAVASTLGTYTQTIAILAVVAQALLVLVTPEGRRSARTWALIQVIPLVAFLPWMAAGIGQASHLGSSHWYLHPPNLHSTFQMLRAVFLSPVPLVSAMPGSSVPGLDRFLPRALLHVMLAGIALVPPLLALWSLRRTGSPRTLVGFCAACVAVPLVAVFVLSFERPLWLPRYFPFVTPFVSALAAFGVSSLSPRLGPLWAGALFLTAGYGDFRYFAGYSKEPWREVTRSIAERATPGESAVVVAFDVDAFDYYNRRLERPLPRFRIGHPEVPFSDVFTAEQVLQMEQDVESRTRPYQEVWLVTRTSTSPSRETVYERTRSIAGAGRELLLRERWESVQQALHVWCWRRGGRPRSPGTVRQVDGTGERGPAEAERSAPRSGSRH